MQWCIDSIVVQKKKRERAIKKHFVDNWEQWKWLVLVIRESVNSLGCGKGIVGMLQSALIMKCTLKYQEEKVIMSATYFPMVHQKRTYVYNIHAYIYTHTYVCKGVWQNVKFSNPGGEHMCSLYYFNYCIKFFKINKLLA